MNFMLAVFSFAVVLVGVKTVESPPKVQVYSKRPGWHGEPNVLICHVSEFHPPDINITLLKDGVEIPNAEQTDLAFQSSWQFHLTKSVAFTPKKGEKYSCRVEHPASKKTYNWEADQ